MLPSCFLYHILVRFITINHFIVCHEQWGLAIKGKLKVGQWKHFSLNTVHGPLWFCVIWLGDNIESLSVRPFVPFGSGQMSFFAPSGTEFSQPLTSLFCGFLRPSHPPWPFWGLLSGSHTWRFTMQCLWHLIGTWFYSYLSNMTFDAFVSAWEQGDMLSDSHWVGQGMNGRTFENREVLFRSKILFLSFMSSYVLVCEAQSYA